MYKHELGSKYYNIQESRELYYLFLGLSYEQIGIKFYSRQKNKFIYKIRKLMKLLNVSNRRQLAYSALKNHLITPEKIKELKNA